MRCLVGFAQPEKFHPGPDIDYDRAAAGEIAPAARIGQALREAANLLANTTQGLDEVAAKIGFANRHYLSRVFKKVTGDSPAHFRRKHGEERQSAAD